MGTRPSPSLPFHVRQHELDRNIKRRSGKFDQTTQPGRNKTIIKVKQFCRFQKSSLTQQKTDQVWERI